LHWHRFVVSPRAIGIDEVTQPDVTPIDTDLIDTLFRLYGLKGLTANEALLRRATYRHAGERRKDSAAWNDSFALKRKLAVSSPGLRRL
jgi:hypothetical protein